MDRTSRCNKVDSVRLYASYRLILLLLKGQRCVAPLYIKGHLNFFKESKSLELASSTKVCQNNTQVVKISYWFNFNLLHIEEEEKAKFVNDILAKLMNIILGMFLPLLAPAVSLPPPDQYLIQFKKRSDVRNPRTDLPQI